MKKIFFIFAALCACTLSTLAYDFTSNGIYYNILGGDSVEVTYGSISRDYWGDRYNANGEYSGSRTIPATVPNGSTTYRVTRIGNYAFNSCSSLTSIMMSNNITSIGYSAFDGCLNLTSITLSNNITSIGYGTFSTCTNLQYTIYDNAEYLTNSDNQCIALMRAINTQITSCEIYPLTKIIGNAAFSDCTNLTSITIPKDVKSIGSSAFSGCSSLSSITIPDGVTSIGSYTFSGCSSLSSIKIPSNITTIGDNTFANCSKLSSIIIPNGVTTLGHNAFSGCSSLSSLTIPNSVKSIYSNAFEQCLSLTSITIPSNIESIGSCVFSGCSNLTSVVWNAKKCADFSQESTPFHYYLILNNSYSTNNFDIRSQITSFTFGDSVEYIPAYLCDGCNLTTITIPNSVTEIGERAFSSTYTLSKLQSVTLGNNISSIGSYAFYGNGRLTTINIPNSVISIDDYAFSYCTGLTSVTIGKGVTSISNLAFNNCGNITSIENNMTSIKTNLFSGLTKLRTITIGDNVQKIESKAFANCTALYQIIAKTENPPVLESDAFSGCSSTILVTVPCGASKYYKGAMYWNTFQYEELFMFNLNVISADSKQGSVSITQHPDCENRSAVFSATPITGYLFTGWHDGFMDNPRTVQVTKDTTFVAEFTPIVVESITLNKSAITLSPNATYQLTANITPAEALNKNVIWTTDDATIATVENGLITAVNYGKTIITATTEDGGKIATCEVEIGVPVQSITLDYTAITLAPSTSKKLTATILPEDATNKNVTWKSENEDIAVVANGWVIAIAEGKTIITVTTEDGTKNASCEITVGVPVSGITLNETTLTMQPGNAKQLIVAIEPSNASNKNYTLTSDNEDVAIVATGGWVIANSIGTATITAQSEDGGIKAMCAVTVTNDVATDIEYQNAVNNLSAQKILKNGTIYILRNGEKYTIDGGKVE